MLTFFRNFFKTKIGLALALAFLALIGFAFASMDVSSSGTFGGIAGGSNVAVVGGEKIGTAALNEAAEQALNQRRQENPSATMQNLLAGNGLDDVLGGLIDRFALTVWGQDNGLRAGQNLVNSEIRQIPAASGATGNFDQAAYQAFLRSNNLTDASLRQQVRTGLMFRQAVYPAIYGSKLPDSLARSYARTFKERRSGSIASIPASLLAPDGDPSDAQLQEFYSENASRFVRPERRTLRYATFGADALGDRIEPTDAEIAEYYQANRDQFAASETRSFTQLIVPTREAAEAIRARVSQGQAFAAAAQGSGLRTTDLADVSRSDLQSDTSSAVAEAYFGAASGAVTQPARSALGWHVARVSDVNASPSRSLAAARPEIEDTLREQKRNRGIAELATGVEDRLADGASFSAIVEDLDLEITSLRPMIASGQFYGAAERAPDFIAPVLDLAFQIEEGEPEIAALPDSQNFVLYEVSEITPSATAPLSEIRDNVVSEWRRVRGNAAAEAAARRIVARVEKGRTLAQAIAAEEVSLPAAEAVNYSREELARMQNASVPAPIALLFGMAEGTVKKLEGNGDQGWYVVELRDIALGELQDNDPLIAQAKTQLGQSWGAEYAEQIIAAMRAEVGVERNSDAIEAVRRQLLGVQD